MKTKPIANRQPPNAAMAAFTLLELLVVIGIITMLTFVALPAIKNIAKSDSMSSANRQLQDDIAYARRMAVRNRSTVYMVFLPANYNSLSSAFSGPDQASATKLLGMQYHGYAMFTWRWVGEQPGQFNPAYLRDWVNLPEGVFIPAWKYSTGNGSVPAFRTTPIPFPEATSLTMMRLPYIAFNYLGQLVQFDNYLGKPLPQASDEIIPLARGALILPTDQTTKEFLWQAPEIVENPPNNSVTTFNHVRVDWMTGRAKVERPEMPLP